MATLNVPIRIKRGDGIPTQLRQGELAFDQQNTKLYIGSGTEVNGYAPNVVELTTPPTVLEDLDNISVGSGALNGDVLVYDANSSEWIAEALSIAWEDVTSKPATFAPSTHASSHHTGGGDAIAPADIGAATASHTHSASDITSGLATVATTGAYSDLSGTPTLGTASASASTDFVAASSVSTFGGSLIDDADAAAARTTLGLGGAAEKADDFYAEASHAHGNITNAGAIGSTSGLPVKTGTSGVLEAGAFGTSAGEFAEGNHTHAWADITSKPSDFTPSAHNHTVTLEISGFIESPEAKTYIISPAIPAAITITQFKAQTSAGTVDLAVHDDGTPVTGCSLADAGTTLAELASAISESVAAGSKLALVVSDLQSSPADLAFSIHYTVTSANNS